jgi:hypothetical protein
MSLIILVVGFIFKKQRNITQQLETDLEKQFKKSKTKQNLKENTRVHL